MTSTRLSILDGELSDVARETLSAVAAALPSPGSRSTDASLASGEAGLALFHGYYSTCALLDDAQRERHADFCWQHLQSALHKLADVTGDLHLYSGFMGVAWAINHLQSVRALDGAEVFCDAADAAVLERLQSRSDSMLCELMGGLSGVGLYGLSRGHKPAGREIVALAVRALERSAITRDGFTTWFHDRARLPPVALRKHPRGCFNLGLAHGVPGTIAFLARAACRHAPGARELLTAATSWLLKQQREYDNGSRFCSYFVDDPMRDGEGSRVGWCYGDLGVSAALLAAADASGRADWKAIALDLAAHAARRTGTKAGVMDAGLCHGAFGNAHIFARLYESTGEDELLTAARYWTREGLRMREPGRGLAGYRAWWPLAPDEAPREIWQQSAGLLDGVCGIGLALLSLLTPLEPRWDEVMGLGTQAGRSVSH